MSEITEKKKTSLGLYVTSNEAYEKWKADPEKVRVVDVRTPEEYIFVGHPEMAWNIPLLFQSYEWDPAAGHFGVKFNPEFVAQVKELAELSETILVMCRSGGRSAVAANQLAKEGFEKVYNVVDGMEGDLVDDPESAYRGKRMKNGWKNSGLPWTYDVDPELVRIPENAGR